MGGHQFEDNVSIVGVEIGNKNNGQIKDKLKENEVVGPEIVCDE